MTSTAHIFNPADASLKAKASAWKKVERSYNDLQKNQARMHDKSWAKRIGSEQELIQASQIIQHSLGKAAVSFKKEELKQAQQAGLLSSKDIESIIVLQRKAQMQSRSNSKQKDSSRSR